MSKSSASAGIPRQVAPGWMTGLFAVTMVLSAALLFMVQPMFARMILPRLGGSPAVWNTCLLFFQVAVFAGYSYIHLASSYLTHRAQVIVHAIWLLLAASMLPIAIPETAPADGSNPIAWLLAALATSVSLPVLMLSTTAPLLQRWFTLATGRDPYFLYAASNAGSLIGLLAYPIVMEPLLTLAGQRALWSAGVAIAIGAIVTCSVFALRAKAGPSASRQPASTQTATTGGTDRLWWVLLSFVPSSLLVGVTTHLSTDVAAVPLIWVVPLAIYLVTFVLAFASPPPLSRIWSNRLAGVFMVAAIAGIVLPLKWWFASGLHVAAFASIALACHRELAERRPPSSSLTRYYLWVSLGGSLGGLFNGLVAPAIFNQVIEYPIVIVLAALIRPSPQWRDGVREPVGAVAVFVLLLVAGAAITWSFGLVPGIAAAALLVAIGLTASAVLAFANRRMPLAAVLAGVVAAHFALPHQESNRVIFEARSFFGVHRVMTDPHVHRLFHGTTLHGWQTITARETCEPTSYFHRSSPIGQLFAALGARAQSVGLIGLGAGALACYGRDDTSFTFYEIDPVVERIARDRALFTFLANARGTVDVVIGDGRVSLARARPSSYDVIVVDAFSSDAIPVHLLTREFLALCLERLRPDGVVALHISNRHLDLAPILGGAAAALGTVAVEQFHRPDSIDASLSRWVIVGKNRAALAVLERDGRWSAIAPASAGWTDDFSNVFDVLRWGLVFSLSLGRS